MQKKYRNVLKQEFFEDLQNASNNSLSNDAIALSYRKNGLSAMATQAVLMNWKESRKLNVNFSESPSPLNECLY